MRYNHPLGNQFVLVPLRNHKKTGVVSLSLKCDSLSLLLNHTNKEVLLNKGDLSILEQNDCAGGESVVSLLQSL